MREIYLAWERKSKLASSSTPVHYPVELPLTYRPNSARYEIAQTSDSELSAIEEQNQAARRPAAAAADRPQQQVSEASHFQQQAGPSTESSKQGRLQKICTFLKWEEKGFI